MTSVHESYDNRIFYRECVSLANAGFDTYLVAKGESREELGVHVVGVGDAPAGRLERMFSFSERIYQKALELDAEIYHLHDPELLSFALKLKKKGKKVIFDSHERYVELIQIKYYLPKWLRSTVAFLYDKFELFVLKRIDAAIFPCTYEGVHPLAGRCRVLETIDNFPALEDLYDNYDPAAIKEKNSICHIGSLTHERGITNLVAAMEKIDGQLFLAGPFSPASYENRLKEMPGWNKVKYLGVLNKNQIPDLLQRCQIGTATLLNVGQYNKYDNLATKVYEYMSLGVPTLLSKAPYNEKMVHKYGFGLCVDPENVDEIAEGIKFLLEYPEEAMQMGLNGREAVKSDFNWGTQEKKLVALYNKL